MFYKHIIVRPILFAFDAEKVHDNLKDTISNCWVNSKIYFGLSLRKLFRYRR